ncbi:MAG: hypothetical protein M1833_001919 [Piccolia ochrophora]|nr:MAG: hypothetical protein M1833_001919 [Piccolia ochrophora]
MSVKHESLPTAHCSPVLTRRDWEHRAPYSSDKVFVRNLAVSATVGVDAFGRRKKQPVSISATIFLSQEFTSAATTDSVDDSTVHYGNLSKNVIAAVEEVAQTELSLQALGYVVVRAINKTVTSPTLIEAWDMNIDLPKASLMGAGVSLAYCWGKHDATPAQVLHIKDVNVAVVVGVNSHEKEVKQRVVMSIWIDPLTTESASDCYGEVEQLAVKSIEDSRFETLESLATHVASMLIKHFVFRMSPEADVRIRVEKPSAIAFADGPGVEVVRRSRPGDALARKTWIECGRSYPPKIPFPLGGSLDEYLQSRVSLPRAADENPPRETNGVNGTHAKNVK